MRSSSRTSLAARWEGFWFQDIPPGIYALLRIVFGLLGLICVLELTPVSMFWSVDGIAPVPGEGIGIRSFLLDRGLGSIAGWTYFACSVVAFSLMTIGYQTRSVVVICFALSALMPLWNHLPLTSANQVLVSLLFCLIWADCSGSPSVDALVAQRRGIQSGTNAQPIWPLRLMRFQVCLIYFNSGIWKFANAVWRDGSAVHYALSLNIFHRFPWPLPPSLDWATTIASYVTMFWEVFFPLMMLHPFTRRFALLLGVALHGGMWSTLELGPFSIVMLSSYLAFLDPVAFSNRFWVRFRPALGPSAPALESHT